MSNDTAKTSTINIVPVQGIFTETAELVTLIGPAGTPFYADIDPNQTGLHITNSTIDSSTIGATTPSTGVFTDIQTTTGSIATAPSADTDIVNKAYVDAVAQGLDIKASCLTASTANITTLSGLLTIDGILLVAGDRVLVKNQSTQANNGIYVASATAWARSADMNTWAEVPSAFTFVESGSTQANSGWVCTSQAGGTLGVTAITFVQFSGAGTYSAGTGLTLTGSQFSITNTGVVAATKGSASKTVTGAVNAQGQLTSFTDQDIAIAGTQITSGTIDTARLSGSYTGITGVGTLTDLTVTNTIVGSITGNAATATTAGSAGSATTATTATNLAGGLIGNVPYQTSAGATTFLATGSNTQVLTLAGGVPTWATPTTGTVTSVSGTGTVNGLTLTGTVTSTGSLTLGGTLDLSAPPAIGGTTAAAITGTTITANTKFLSTYFDANTSAGGSLRNLSGTACFQWGAGGGTNCTVDGSINMNGLNAHIDMSPTGTGHVTINPTALGDMNNMAIGASTASTAKFTTLDISSTLALAGSTGSSGQTLVSQGASAPIWATPTAYASVTDDTTTNATRYPLFASVTTGNLTTEYVSSTKYNFNPSTGTLSATVFSGSGASLTSIPNSALTNSSVTIGSTAVALGATVTTFAGLTSVTSTTFVGALTGNADTATSATTATNATNTAITDDTTNASAVYPTWVTTTTGNLPQKTSSTKLSFIPNTGILTATGFSGPLTGNVTGNVSGSSGSCTGNAATVTTNANLTGPITSAGNATSIASQTGTGTTFVMSASPTLVSPSIGTTTGGLVKIDGWQRTFTAATTSIFTLRFEAEAAAFVDIAIAGIITAVGGVAEITRYAINEINGAGATVSQLSKNGTSTISTSVATAAGFTTVTFLAAGHAAFAATYQINISINGVSALGATGGYDAIVYTRI